MSTSAVLAARTYYPKQVFELAALKPRESDAWSLGEYPVFGATLQIAAENLCEVLDLRAGSTVLDVASGGGNASIAAARRWCVVAAVDSVASHLDKVANAPAPMEWI
jgi:2-polyprenyl-3-methyl-5-hydroxy-6-metoxy-1,4-benzoquinol methylase